MPFLFEVVQFIPTVGYQVKPSDINTVIIEAYLICVLYYFIKGQNYNKLLATKSNRSY